MVGAWSPSSTVWLQVIDGWPRIQCSRNLVPCDNDAYELVVLELVPRRLDVRQDAVEVPSREDLPPELVTAHVRPLVKGGVVVDGKVLLATVCEELSYDLL